MFTFNCRGRLFLIDRPLVMGIINATPDSFYSKSRKTHLEEVIGLTGDMISNGASIIDVGGQSTRPGSKKVAPDEEWQRVAPIIEAIKTKYPGAFVSIDTYYASVAEKAVLSGADMVNDIGSGKLDPDMLNVVSGLQVPYICMHMVGNPQTMHLHTQYTNLVKEVIDFFIDRFEHCKQIGITDLIIDPGFGFSKTIAQNFELLRNLGILRILQAPILAGLSRKGTIYKTLGTTAEQALNGTSVLNTIALLNGASILRVHDVKEACEAIRLVEHYVAAGALT